MKKRNFNEKMGDSLLYRDVLRREITEMKKQTVKTTATILIILGILFMLAGPAFNFIPERPAIFAGIVCFILSGVIPGFFSKKK
jgi:hypothetical protein